MLSKVLWLLVLLTSCTSAENKQEDVIQDFLQHKIEIVVPGSECDLSLLDNSLKSHNIKFNRAFSETHQKLQNLKNALLDQENELVWALRGGYGTASIVDLLYEDHDFMSAMKKKTSYPLFIGYCDVTALHLFLSQEFGWKTLHGPVIKELTSKRKRNSFHVLSKVLDGITRIKFVGLQALNNKGEITAEIKGKMTGGNLSIIQTSIGARWQIQTKNKILFLEDCHEKPHKILRMLSHLKMAGLFDGVRAVIVGNLCDDSDYMRKSIISFFSTLAIPTYAIDVFGHGMYNYPILYNADVSIQLMDGVVSLTQNF